MKDKKVNLRDLQTLYGLGCEGDWNTPKDRDSLIDERFENVMGECVN